MKFRKIGFWALIGSLLAQNAQIAYAAKLGKTAQCFVAMCGVAAAGAESQPNIQQDSVEAGVVFSKGCVPLPYNCSNMNELPYDFNNATASLPVNEAYSICLHAGAIGPFNNPFFSPRPWLLCVRSDGTGLVPGLTVFNDTNDILVPERSRIPADQQERCAQLSSDQTCGCLQVCKDGKNYYSNNRGQLTHCLKEDIVSWELTRPHYIDENGEDKNYTVHIDPANCTTNGTIIQINQWRCPTGERVDHASDCPPLPFNCSNMNDLPYDFSNETVSLPVNEAYTICKNAGAIGPFGNPFFSQRPWLVCMRENGGFAVVPGLTVYNDSDVVFVPEKASIPEDQQNRCAHLSSDQTCGCVQVCKDGKTFYANNRGQLTNCLKGEVVSWELTRPFYIDENGESKDYIVHSVEPVQILSGVHTN